jgi:hypothetical protein
MPFVNSRLPAGFSPHEVHSKSTFFGWILPTLRTSEFTVLQIVGLDAAVVSGNVRRMSGLYLMLPSAASQFLQVLVLLLRDMYPSGGGGPCTDQLS